jgi:predicted RNA polymerase sigma factor
VPLSEQQVSRWSMVMIEEANVLLGDAARMGRMGRFQLEGAIQSVHGRRALTGRTDWEAIALLYEGLVRIAPTIGAMVGRAAATGEAFGAAAGMIMLEEIPGEVVRNYQPYWALSGHLLRRLERVEEAREATGRAMGLCEDEAMREFLRKRMG